ncbi:hypothetical protein Fcan01_00084 [Folsomia candida]|uniref:Uncharacterized protein n=1 Tax=Folsomia candida TaxID=158441 RepID=A0A226EWH8_FOLCA|nr:hypothetical protein Fcan01_00084 [Folsomia candida]
MWTKRATKVTDQSPASVISLQAGNMDKMKGGVQGFPKLSHSYGLKLVKVLILVSEVSIRAIATFQFALLTYVPCSPPFIMSMLPTSNQDSTITVKGTQPEVMGGNQISYDKGAGTSSTSNGDAQLSIIGNDNESPEVGILSAALPK